MLEFLLAELGKDLLAKGVDELVSTLERTGAELRAEVSALRGELREGFDDQKALHLTSAVEQLEYGRYDDAINCLVYARNSERDRNPVATLLMGVAHAHEGRPDVAAKLVAKATSINPFVFGGLDDVLDESLAASLAPAPPPRWLRLSRAQPRATWRMKVLAAALPDSRAEALGVSYDPMTARGYAVLLWDRAPSFGFEVTKVLTSLPLVDGDAHTRTLNEPAKLALVTPRFVVVERANGDFGFYDVATLEPHDKDMRRKYFELVFCPSWPAVRESARYRRSHQSFDSDTARARRALAAPERPELGYEFRQEGRTLIARESVCAQPPFGPEEWQVRALNEYWLGRKSITDSTPTLHCRGAFGRASVPTPVPA
jgi:hypothetical protein